MLNMVPCLKKTPVFFLKLQMIFAWHMQVEALETYIRDVYSYTTSLFDILPYRAHAAI